MPLKLDRLLRIGTWSQQEKELLGDGDKSKISQKEVQKGEGSDEKKIPVMPGTNIQDNGSKRENAVDELRPESKELKLYSRCLERKTLFVPQSQSADDTTTTAENSLIQTPASYFLLNPRGNKHASEWRPHLYLGDNPKYPQFSSSSVGGSQVDGISRVYGRARRRWLWSSFSIEIGEGVEMEVANKKVRIETKKRRRIAWWRRKLKMKEKVYEEGPGEEGEVRGRVVKIEMERGGWGKGAGGWRVLSWRFSGDQNGGAEEDYRWVGSRGENKGRWWRRMKGVGPGLKLIRASDGKCLATINRSYFSEWNKTEKLGGPPNKKRRFIGSLKLFTAKAMPGPEMKTGPETDLQSEGGKTDVNGKEVLLSEAELLEMAIVFTGWIAAEGEHRLRNKWWDVILEIAETFGE